MSGREYLLASYPRIFLDLELYRPKRRGAKGRTPFFHADTKIIVAAITVEESPGRSREEFLAEWSLGEKRLLRETIRILSETVSNAGRRPLLIGYNILVVDLPVLLYRARLLLRREEQRGLESLLYRRFLPIDIFQQILPRYRGWGLPSFSWLEQELLGVEPKGSGYRVHELYEAGRYGEILEYSRDEMRRLRRVYEALIAGLETHNS